MSDRPDRVEHGSRATSTSQPPPSRPEPGPGRPVRSNGPERTPLTGPGPRARRPEPGPEGPALRVVLVSRDRMLAGALRSLIETPGGVRMLDWYSEELDNAIRHADVVIVDMPPTLHQRTFDVLAGRFLGRTVVLLQEGEHTEAVPPGPARAILYRPLQIGELWAAVTGAGERSSVEEGAEPGAEEAGGSVAPRPEFEPEAESPPGPELQPEPDPIPEPEFPRQPDPSPDPELQPEPEVAAGDRSPVDAAAAADVEAQGLPVAESGRLIGLSGQELDPVIGPGQVAPGMDEATFERLRGWKTGPGARPPAGQRKGPAPGRRRSEPESGAARRARAAEADALREQAHHEKEARAEDRQAARTEAGRQRAARADARTAAREESLQAKAVKAEARRIAREERQARAEEARQARAARAGARLAAREEARQARAARTQARKAARAEAREAKAARAEERRAAQAESRQAATAEAEARRAARDEARREAAAEAEARRAAREVARQTKAAAADTRRAERAEARQAEAAEAEARRAARDEARRAEAAAAEARQAEQAAARRVAREQSRQAKIAQAEERRAARDEAVRARTAQKAASRETRAAKAADRKAARAEAKEKRAAAAEVRRQQAQQEKAAKAEAREAARAEAARERAARAETHKAARGQARQEKAARTEERRAARAAKAEERRATRAAKAEERQATRAAAAQATAAKAEAQQAARTEAKEKRAAEAEAGKAERAARAEAQEVARREAEQARAVQAEERRVAKAAEAEQRQAAEAEAAQKRAAEAEARQLQAQQAKAAKAEARASARAEAGQAKAARAEARRAAREEAGRQRAAARTEARPVGAAGAGARIWNGLALPALVVLLLAVLGVAAAGWVGTGGADTRAGEVAVVRAAGGNGLVVQDPRMGPIAPLHALGVGVWLRVTEAGGSLEAVIREARVPSRFLLAGVVGLTVVLFLLLMRVGPGSGAAAGPGPAPPQRPGRPWRLGGAALAGGLVALDPQLVQSGRSATGTVLAVLLSVGTVALAWGVPARPALRWLPLVAAAGGLALLVSPLALAVVAVPMVAELLQGRYREAWKDMAALGLAIGLWLLLPVWVAGQDLGAGQAGWLLGRPSGRGSVAASVAAAPLTWLLVAAGLAAAVLTWRHRSGARSHAGPEGARLLAWAATSAAGALGAIALGYPAERALPFAVPAAAVSVAMAGVTLVAAGGTRQAGEARQPALVVPRWIAAGTGVVLVGLLAAQAVDWAGRYGKPADDGLGRLVATVGAEVPSCSAVNASGPDDRARLLAAGVTVTEFSNGPAAHAAGIRYFVLTGGTQGPMSPSLAAWVRQHGTRLVAHPSRSLSGVELWRVDAAPLDPVADLIPLPDGVFSNTTGSACGGYRVVDSQVGAFHTAYRSVGGKAVLGRPLGSVWTSDGPALQAFDTMVLGAVPTASGPPAVRPIELPPLLAKLDVEAVADADIPLPSTRPPVTDRQVRALLRDELIGRAYLGTDPATATEEDFRRARDRFGRPLGLPQTMPDGAIRQPFERAVLELPADGGPVRPAALGRLAVELGLVPKQAMRPEPVPGLPTRPVETRLDPAPLLRLVGGALALLLLAAGAGAVLAGRSRAARAG